MSLKDRGVVLPLAMGHEIVGRVVKLGPEATGVAVGDLRIVFPWVGCGRCDRCLAEEDNMCAQGKALGIYQNGGYATHVLAMEPRHLVDPGTVDPALAATYACSGITVYSAIKKIMPLPPDAPVVLVGAGRPRAERDRRAEGDGPSRDHLRRHQRGEACRRHHRRGDRDGGWIG